MDGRPAGSTGEAASRLRGKRSDRVEELTDAIQILLRHLADPLLAHAPVLDERSRRVRRGHQRDERLRHVRDGKLDQMLVEKDITFYSHCEHHFVPIYGKAHVAYFSTGKVIGLSKINRIVQFFAKRPQVQERLTMQIGNEMQRVLHTEDVGVVMDANHMCVASRGVGDTNSKTGTAYFSGKFKDENIKREFLNYINSK